MRPQAPPEGPPPADPLLPGPRRLLAFGGELVAAGITATVVSIGIQLVVNRLSVPMPSQVPLALNTWGSAAVIALLLALLACGLRDRWRRAANLPAWAALSALTTVPLCMTLLGTRHYLNGVSGDQSFRVEYLTRFVDSPALADMAYPDLPPYYPAAWFWIGGRAAALAGIPGWEAYKPYAIVTMAVAGVLAFCVWCLVMPRGPALAMAFATTVVGLRIAAYTPYSWIVTAAVPPLAVLALRLLRAAVARAPARRWAGGALLVGLMLGAVGAVHSLIFWFVGLVLVVLGIAVVVGAARRERFAALLRLVVPALLVGGAALLVVLSVWTPYLLRVLESGSRSGASQRFLPESGALVPLPMTEASVTGALALVGVVWLVAHFPSRTSRSDDVAQALGMLVATAYAWYALSTLALAAGTTLLAFRLEPLIDAGLACAGVLGVVEGVRAAGRRFGRPTGRPLTVAVAAVLAFGAALSLVQSAPAEYAYAQAAEYGDYYPTGQRPVGAPRDTDAGAWNNDLVTTINGLTGRPPRDVVVLSTSLPILSYTPYRSFQMGNDSYANPLADFPARRARIQQWAATRTPQALLAALDASPVPAPTVFVLAGSPQGLRMDVSYDVFPQQPNVRGGAVYFDPRVFADPAFETRTVGPFTVVVRR